MPSSLSHAVVTLTCRRHSHMPSSLSHVGALLCQSCRNLQEEFERKFIYFGRKNHVLSILMLKQDQNRRIFADGSNVENQAVLGIFEAESLITYGVATMSRLFKIIDLFCRISSLCRALWQKRPTILRSLLIVATPYMNIHQQSGSPLTESSKVRHDSFIHVLWLIYMCVMTRSYVCHDTNVFIPELDRPDQILQSVTRLILTRYIIHWCVYHD